MAAVNYTFDRLDMLWERYPGYHEMSVFTTLEELLKDHESWQEEDYTMTDKIEVFCQNSIRIRDRIGNIYIDPFRMEEEPHDADIIFITHEHFDHYSPEDIGKAAGEHTTLVIPESMEGRIADVSGLMKKTVTVKPGEAYETDGLEFETVAAYNIDKSFHPKSAGWVGYILKIDGRRVYIAGDTDATEEAKAVQCDVALVPIGGTYTMNAEQAAELINILKPDTAIPVHYGSVVGSSKDADRFAGKVGQPVRVEIKLP